MFAFGSLRLFISRLFCGLMVLVAEAAVQHNKKEKQGEKNASVYFHREVGCRQLREVNLHLPASMQIAPPSLMVKPSMKNR